MAMECHKPDEHHRLTFAHAGYSCLPPEFYVYAPTLRSLDASSNRITNLDGLEQCFGLETLILDDNGLRHNMKLPYLPELRYLSVNNNKISSLSTFVELLKKQCPKLRWISMLNNDACPNYFNQGTVAEYNEYRLCLIANLGTLKIIDSLHITDKERERATRETLERSLTPREVFARGGSRASTRSRSKSSSDFDTDCCSEEELLMPNEKSSPQLSPWKGDDDFKWPSEVTPLAPNWDALSNEPIMQTKWKPSSTVAPRRPMVVPPIRGLPGIQAEGDTIQGSPLFPMDIATMSPPSDYPMDYPKSQVATRVH